MNAKVISEYVKKSYGKVIKQMETDLKSYTGTEKFSLAKVLLLNIATRIVFKQLTQHLTFQKSLKYKRLHDPRELALSEICTLFASRWIRKQFGSIRMGEIGDLQDAANVAFNEKPIMQHLAEMWEDLPTHEHARFRKDLNKKDIAELDMLLHKSRGVITAQKTGII